QIRNCVEDYLCTTFRPTTAGFDGLITRFLADKQGVAETKYEFKCRDVPWNVSTGVLTSSQIVFILQISNALFIR
ncbi:hypothetical protein PN456_03395, partial [Nodularia spumigena CS-586/05]|uniref:hypothetical protein n=1 Tax=Nodularia spumigena TaxID=70799 RepID=UPI00232CA6A6